MKLGIQLRRTVGVRGILDTVLGTAHPATAVVYYEHAVRGSQRARVPIDLPLILGCIMAHEIGHMLLGPNSHSTGGIMRGEWDAESIRLMTMGTLLFPSQQARTMQLQARRRSVLQTEVFDEPHLAAMDLSQRPRTNSQLH